MTAEVSAVTAQDATRALVRLAALHAGLVAVPTMVLLLVVVPVWAALPLAVVAGTAVTAVRLRGMDARVGASLGAQAADERTHARLVNLVEHLSMAAGVSRPRIQVIDTPAANAVVWGTGNGAASIAATTGLLAMVERVELEAVVAHLLAEIRDHRIEAPTAAAALFGGRLAGPLRRIALGPFTERHVVATDLAAARVTRYPPGSVAALERLQAAASTAVPSPVPLRPLWIVDPIEGVEDGAFALHPSLADRIDLLREL